jgi:hypothetical protein
MLFGAVAVLATATVLVQYIYFGRDESVSPRGLSMPQSQFVAQPHLKPIGGHEQVQWVLPTLCESNRIVLTETERADGSGDGPTSEFGDIGCSSQMDGTWVCTADLLQLLADSGSASMPPFDVRVVAERCDGSKAGKMSASLRVPELVDVESYRDILEPYLAASEGLGLAAVLPESVWATSMIARNITKVFRIDRQAGDVVAYDLAGKSVLTPEFALDPSRGMVVYSTFVPALAADEGVRQRASLRLHDLENNTDTELLEEVRVSPFMPAWTKGGQIEYAASVGGGKVIFDIGSL